jgi:hypothetical protein
MYGRMLDYCCVRCGFESDSEQEIKSHVRKCYKTLKGEREVKKQTFSQLVDWELLKMHADPDCATSAELTTARMRALEKMEGQKHGS